MSGTVKALAVARDESTRLQALRAQRRVFDLLPFAHAALEDVLVGFLELFQETDDPEMKVKVGREIRKTAVEWVISRTVPTLQRSDHRVAVMSLPLGQGEVDQVDAKDAAAIKAEQSQRERTEILRALLERSHSNGNGNGHGSRAGLVMLGEDDARAS